MRLVYCVFASSGVIGVKVDGQVRFLSQNPQKGVSSLVGQNALGHFVEKNNAVVRLVSRVFASSGVDGVTVDGQVRFLSQNPQNGVSSLVGQNALGYFIEKKNALVRLVYRVFASSGVDGVNVDGQVESFAHHRESSLLMAVHLSLYKWPGG